MNILYFYVYSTILSAPMFCNGVIVCDSASIESHKNTSLDSTRTTSNRTSHFQKIGNQKINMIQSTPAYVFVLSSFLLYFCHLLTCAGATAAAHYAQHQLLRHHP